MIKVLEIITSLDDGGAETLVKDYAILLNKEKIDVKIVTIQNVTNTANYQRLCRKNISVLSVYKKYNILSRLSRKCIGRWYVPFILKRIIADEKPDCIHIHLPILFYFKKISKELQGIKLLYTCHNVPEIIFSKKHYREKESAKYLIIQNQMQMIALHDEMRLALNKMFGINNTVVIRNGVDFQRFRNIRKSREEIRGEIGIPTDAFVVGHIGRFSEQKNHTFLIDVFYELCREKSNAYLLLIGTGSLENEVRKKVKDKGLGDKLRILSHRTDVPELLNAMDIFVFPSLFEGLSVTLVEAQVAGVRCIVSDRVNTESVLTEDTILVSLDEGPRQWASYILDDTKKNLSHGNLDDFNMNNEMITLEQLYLKDNQ